MTLRIALALIALAGAARAELQRFPRATADKAMTRLADGTLIVWWASHVKSKTPTVYRVGRPLVDGTGDDCRIVARLTRVAASDERTDQRGFTFRDVEEAPSEGNVLDLAYVFVPSRELPGVFVNLARYLGDSRPVGQVAVEVPAVTLGAIEAADTKRAAGGGFTRALTKGKLAPGTEIRLEGRIRAQGELLVIDDERHGAYVIGFQRLSDRDQLREWVGQVRWVRGTVVGGDGGLDVIRLDAR